MQANAVPIFPCASVGAGHGQPLPTPITNIVLGCRAGFDDLSARVTMGRAMAGGVIGRNTELASIGELLVKIEGGPAALVLSGEAGIGKTVLWDAGVGR